jgi:hypothetical protein
MIIPFVGAEGAMNSSTVLGRTLATDLRSNSLSKRSVRFQVQIPLIPSLKPHRFLIFAEAG